MAPDASSSGIDGEAVDAAVAAHGEALAALAAGDVAGARAYAARALELLIAARGADDPDVANVLLAASRIEQAGGDPLAARAHAAAAVAAARTWVLDDPDLAGLRFDAEHDLAMLDQTLGDLDAAERRLLDALAAARAVPSGGRSVLLLTNALGVTYKFAGRLGDAQRRYDEVYDLLRSDPQSSRDDLAGLFHNLAGLAHARGDAADGILWAQRGIALRGPRDPGDAPGLDLARDIGQLGALQHLGGRLDDARASYATAERAYAAALGPDHYEVGVVLANRGALEADAGDPAAARALYDRAIAQLAATLGPDHADVAHVRDNLRGLLAGERRRQPTPGEDQEP